MADPKAPAIPVHVPGSLGGIHHCGFTQRERAAIDLRVPNSGVDWLDAMIREARRWDMATAVVSGFAADPQCISAEPNADHAMKWADALFSRLSAPRPEGGAT